MVGAGMSVVGNSFAALDAVGPGTLLRSREGALALDGFPAITVDMRAERFVFATAAGSINGASRSVPGLDPARPDWI